MVVNVGQNPPDITEIMCIEEMFGILPKPQTKSADTLCTDIRIKVAKTMNKYTITSLAPSCTKYVWKSNSPVNKFFDIGFELVLCSFDALRLNF